MAVTMLDVNELFGPTVQGEGPSLGRRCAFVRLSRCNLDCGEGPGATWRCDTPYTWRWQGRYDDRVHRTYLPVEEQHRASVGHVADEVLRRGVGLCVVSGGEPLLQRTAVAELAEALSLHGIDTEVETNGTIDPGVAYQTVTAFNVSPKLSNSGVELSKRYRPDLLAQLAHSGQARFKFVAAHLPDLDEIAALVAAVPLPDDLVWVMPAGTTPGEVGRRLKALAGATIQRGWNLTTRLHVEAWGDQRGR